MSPSPTRNPEGLQPREALILFRETLSRESPISLDFGTSCRVLQCLCLFYISRENRHSVFPGCRWRAAHARSRPRPVGSVGRTSCLAAAAQAQALASLPQAPLRFLLLCFSGSFLFPKLQKLGLSLSNTSKFLQSSKRLSRRLDSSNPPIS